VTDEVELLDQRIEAAVAHWRLDRLGMGERLVLRIGTYELLRGEVPPKVAIDEALWLARRFAGEEAVGLVNGVLDRIARDLGVL
jgi:N utilization substance protein B